MTAREALAAAASPASRRRYTLTPRADLAVFFAADSQRYRTGPRRHYLDLVSAETFAAFYASSPSRGFAFDGRPIGGMIFDGVQPHIAVLPEHHGRWTPLLAPALDWLFGLQPEMRVDIESDNATALAFMERNGWPRVGQEHDDPLRGRLVTFQVGRLPKRPPRRQVSNR